MPGNDTSTSTADEAWQEYLRGESRSMEEAMRDHSTAPTPDELENLRGCQRVLGQYLDEDRILYPRVPGETVSSLRAAVARLAAALRVTTQDAIRTAYDWSTYCVWCQGRAAEGATLEHAEECLVRVLDAATAGAGGDDGDD